MSRGTTKRVVAGLIVLMLAGTAAAVVTIARQRAQDRRALNTLLNAVETTRYGNTAQVNALTARMEQLHLDSYLTAQQLASVDGLKEGRSTLMRYRQLLAEREHLLDEMSARSNTLLAGLPHGRTRDDALLGQAISPQGKAEVRRRLSVAIAANADAVQAIFDWVGRNQRYLHARGDVLQIEGQPRIAELDGLEYTLHDTGKAIQEAMAAGQELESQSSQALDSLRRNLER